jgi:hypothetical protein
VSFPGSTVGEVVGDPGIRRVYTLRLTDAE